MANGGGGRGRGHQSRRHGRGRGPFVPIVLLVLVAVGVGAFLWLNARSSRAAEQDTVTRYAQAWGKQDFAGMYRTLDATSRGRVDEARFTGLNRNALSTATTTKLVLGELVRDGETFTLPVAVHTRLFGTLRAKVRIPITGSGKDARVRWSTRMAFPGLRNGETLARTTEMPPRADILARDGKTALAKGPDRTSDIPNTARQVVGTLGTANPDDAALMRKLGVPSDAKVGVSGLERILNPELVGKPGGTLKAGDRVLREVAPQKAPAVRSSISIAVVQAATKAQEDAPDASGTMVVNARTGEVLGFQGSAWSALQPPGSTMKIITAAASLEDGVNKTTTVYPHETEAKGYGIQNSNQEPCGGTFVDAFAHSCNSVFVPLGAKIGGKRFVEMAEAFGFNRPTPGVPGAQISRLPKEMGPGEAAVSAIGQGKVEATALQIALMTATIANGGREPRLTFVKRSQAAPSRRVISAGTAREMRQLMAAVISNGTGSNARVDLPGITTGGKTGTAELASTQGPQCDAEAAAAADQPEGDGDNPDPPSACGNTDGKSTTAWMSAFAPLQRHGDQDPIAVGVLRARNFQGGQTAAPVAKSVLTAALGG